MMAPRICQILSNGWMELVWMVGFGDVFFCVYSIFWCEMRVGNGVDIGRVSIEMNFGGETFGGESPVLRGWTKHDAGLEQKIHHFLVNAIKTRWIFRFFEPAILVYRDCRNPWVSPTAWHRRFEKVHQETFGKTGCRRIVSLEPSWKWWGPVDVSDFLGHEVETKESNTNLRLSDGEWWNLLSFESQKNIHRGLVCLFLDDKQVHLRNNLTGPTQHKPQAITLTKERP